MNKAKQIKQANKHDEKLKKKNRKAKLNRNILKISICINKKLKQEMKKQRTTESQIEVEI